MTGVDTANLALAAQTLTMAMTTNETTRVRERAKDKSSKSLISNLGPGSSAYLNASQRNPWEMSQPCPLS